MRRHNLSLVLREVFVGGPRSRATIAADTGLTKATVSALAHDLITRGLLVEQGLDDSRVGRPGRLLGLDGSSVVGIGVEINVDYLAVCALDLLGRVRHETVERRENRGRTVGSVIDTVTATVSRALDDVSGQGLAPVGAAVAVPALVDVEQGRVLMAPNLGWEQVDLGAELTRRLAGRLLVADTTDTAVTVDNEANCAALGELWEGGGQEWGDFLLLMGEIGVGAGLVVGGQLVRGATGFAGEIGHLPVEPDGPPCPCGSRGCLERLVGQEALLRQAGVAPAPELGTSIGQPLDGGIAQLVRDAEAGRPQTLAALDQAGRTLGVALATAVNLLGVHTVALGGIFASLAPWLRDVVEAELQSRAFVTRHAPVRVVTAQLGATAAVRGAASSVLRGVLADPYRVAVSPASRLPVAR